MGRSHPARQLRDEEPLQETREEAHGPGFLPLHSVLLSVASVCQQQRKGNTSRRVNYEKRCGRTPMSLTLLTRPVCAPPADRYIVVAEAAPRIAWQVRNLYGL